MSRRRAYSELLQRLVMAFHLYPGAPVVGVSSRRPLKLRAAASNFVTRALDSSSTPWPPPSALSSLARRPRIFFYPLKVHAGAICTSSSILSRSSHSHRAHRSFSAAGTSVDAAAAASSSSTDANDDDSDGSLDTFLAPPSVTFASLGLDSQVCDALRAAGIAHPSAVQVKIIVFPPLFQLRSHSFFSPSFLLTQKTLSSSSFFSSSSSRPRRSRPCSPPLTRSSQRRQDREKPSPI